jgi:hypothetical protein
VLVTSPLNVAHMTTRRGRLIIGERPAPDLVECMHCRRRWDASLQTSSQCLVCKTVWDAPPEWDQRCLIRKLWIIESRWRIGIGHGPWQFEEEWPGSLTTDEIEAIVEEMRNVEKQRCLRYKPEMRFEYRVVDRLVESLRERVVCQR